MKNSDEYLTIAGPSTGLYKEKGSKFLAFAFSVSTTEQINEILTRLKKEHHGAQHHCYAYILGMKRNEYRMHDNGEPANTAGKPIFNQIASRKLTNILVMVIRYFGGVLLGKGGLIRAYKNAAANALDHASVIKMIHKERYRICFDYKDINNVMKIIGETELDVISQKYEHMAQIEISIRKNKIPRVMNQFKMLDNIIVEPLDKKQD